MVNAREFSGTHHFPCWCQPGWREGTRAHGNAGPRQRQATPGPTRWSQLLPYVPEKPCDESTAIERPPPTRGQVRVHEGHGRSCQELVTGTIFCLCSCFQTEMLWRTIAALFGSARVRGWTGSELLWSRNKRMVQCAPLSSSAEPPFLRNGTGQCWTSRLAALSGLSSVYADTFGPPSS